MVKKMLTTVLSYLPSSSFICPLKNVFADTHQLEIKRPLLFFVLLFTFNTISYASNCFIQDIYGHCTQREATSSIGQAQEQSIQSVPTTVYQPNIVQNQIQVGNNFWSSKPGVTIKVIFWVTLVVLSIYGLICTWSNEVVYFDGWGDLWANFVILISPLIVFQLGQYYWSKTIGMVLAVISVGGGIYYNYFKSSRTNKHIHPLIFCILLFSRMTIGWWIPFSLVGSVAGILDGRDGRTLNHLAWLAMVGTFTKKLIDKSKENYRIHYRGAIEAQPINIANNVKTTQQFGSY